MAQITAGARALRAWLDQQGMSIPVFAEKFGFDRITVQRMVKGERQRVSVDFAAQVERATNGAVPVASWASATAVAKVPSPDDSGPHESPSSPDTEADLGCAPTEPHIKAAS